MSRSESSEQAVAIACDVSDAELEALLTRVYVDGGFTPADLAVSLFAAAAVRARGELLVARDEPGRGLLGTVIVVPPTSPSRRIAADDEAEMHLLAVSSEHRGRGIGSRLVEAAIGRARHGGWSRMVLWTQPSMHSAQKLYEAHGFVRVPERDPQITKVTGRTFLVFGKTL